MRTRDAVRGEKGLTLVEVLISLTVLAVVSLGITTMLSMALHLDDLAKERSVATALATERIQRVTSLPFQTSANYARYLLPEETAAAGPPVTFTTAFGVIPGYPEYQRVVELSYDVPMSGMLRVKTTVSWRHVGQPERQHEMIAFLHPGLE